MAVISTLVAKLVARTEDFHLSMGRAKKDLQEFGASTTHIEALKALDAQMRGKTISAIQAEAAAAETARQSLTQYAASTKMAGGATTQLEQSSIKLRTGLTAINQAGHLVGGTFGEATSTFALTASSVKNLATSIGATSAAVGAAGAIFAASAVGINHYANSLKEASDAADVAFAKSNALGAAQFQKGEEFLKRGVELREKLDRTIDQPERDRRQLIREGASEGTAKELSDLMKVQRAREGMAKTAERLMHADLTNKRNIQLEAEKKLVEENTKEWSKYIEEMDKAEKLRQERTTAAQRFLVRAGFAMESKFIEDPILRRIAELNEELDRKRSEAKSGERGQIGTRILSGFDRSLATLGAEFGDQTLGGIHEQTKMIGKNSARAVQLLQSLRDSGAFAP